MMVGATLLAFTAITVSLSYVNFGTQKANVAVALLVATFKAGLVAAIFMHLSAEKKAHLPHPHFHRLFCPRSLLAHLSRVVRLPDQSLMSLKGFHILFIIFSTLLALGCGAWCIWVDLTVENLFTGPEYLSPFSRPCVLIIYGVWFYRKMKRLRIFT